MGSDRVLLAHGGGGLLTKELIQSVILPVLDNPLLHPLDDAAVLRLSDAASGVCVAPGGPHATRGPEGADGPEGRAGDLAFTTDSYVVSPLFFPGGDIGELAVCGTVNDLAVKGAEPLWMSLGLVLEEGLPMADLEAVIRSVGSAAREAGIQVVTGDTKVVEKGRCDGMYLNTAGIGRIVTSVPLGPQMIRPGDAIIVNGFLGDHGTAIMARRSGISFSPELVSDCAPLWDLVRAALATGAEIHAMRDLTRGGLAGALCDIAEARGLDMQIRETELPVRSAVRGACDLLGFEPIAVANEGKLVIFCAALGAEDVLAALRSHPLGSSAAVIGEVTARPGGKAVLATRIGGERIIDMPPGETLPRIC
jgi:hydrogenase expression/formation protein HypE